MSIDLNNIRFDLTKKGYSTDQVDSFIDGAAGEIDLLTKENQRLQQENLALCAQIEEYKAKELAIEQSILEASNLRNEIIEKARADADKLIEDSKELVEIQKNKLEALKNEEASTIKRVRYILEAQLANLEFVINEE